MDDNDQEDDLVDELEDVLEQLRERLNKSYVDKAHYMKHHSTHKKECQYYKKAMQLFEIFDLEEIKGLVRQSWEMLNCYEHKYSTKEQRNLSSKGD